MGVLDELQAMALDESVQVTGILRYCSLLARRINDDELKTWINYEIQGYPEMERVPDYRKVSGAIHFDAANSAWTTSNRFYSMEGFPPEIRNLVDPLELRFSIVQIQQLANEDSVKLTIPPVATKWIDDHLTGRSRTTSTYQRVARSTLLGILEAVRYQILDLVESLSKESPEVNRDSFPKLSTTQQSGSGNVSQNFYGSDVTITTVTGDQNITTVGNKNKVNVGDRETLRTALKEQGIADEDIDELESFIDEEKGSFNLEETSRGDGRVGGWIRGSLGKVIKGGANQLLAIAMNIVASIIYVYYFGAGS